MSTPKHTPEKLKVFQKESQVATGHEIYFLIDAEDSFPHPSDIAVLYGGGNPLAKDQAHRLTQCWNALRGIDDPEKFVEQAKRVCEVPVQRLAHCLEMHSELVEALKLVYEHFNTKCDKKNNHGPQYDSSGHIIETYCPRCEASSKAFHALAKAEAK